MEERETLGELLQREREQKRISLKDLAKMTKVKEHFLRAIEENRHERLPSPIYVKGFLSAYAIAIGLNPKEILLRYERLLKRESVVSPEIKSEKRPSKRLSRNWLPIGLVSGVVAICLLFSYFFHPYFIDSPVESPPKKLEIGETVPLLPTTATVVMTPVVEKKPFSIELRAVEETWVQIQVNNQPKREALYKPGERDSFQAYERIELLIGNGGGLDLIFNGEMLERFGKSGEVVRLVFTPEGVEQKGRGEERTPQKD